MADPNDILASLGHAVTPGTALAGLGLGYAGIRGNQPPPEENSLRTEASLLGQEGSTLLKAAEGGPLPPNAQAQLNQGEHAATAAVRSNYSKLGLSGSTMEAQAMQNVAQQTAAQGFEMAQGMFKDGIAMSGLSAEILKAVMARNSEGDQAFGKAIGNFAAAFAGGDK